MNREFKTDTKNKKWVIDVSHIPSRENILYLSVIRDLFDNSIISYKTSISSSNKLVFDAFMNVLEREIPNDLHSMYQYLQKGVMTLQRLTTLPYPW